MTVSCVVREGQWVFGLPFGLPLCETLDVLLIAVDTSLTIESEVAAVDLGLQVV